jgi:hypothetical protein
MKTSFNFVALLLAAGFSAVLLAQLAGLSIGAFLSVDSAVGFFVAAFILLFAVRDYARKPRHRTVLIAPVMTPPASAFTRGAAKAERLAA